VLGRFLLDIIKRGPARALSADRPDSPLSAGDGARNPVILQLDDINCVVRGRHGWFLANGYDRYLGRALIRYGECCEIEHRFLAALLGQGDIVIEVGANIGVHTIGLAKAVGQGGQVIAIEPQPPIFQVLCANLALNGIANTTPLAFGCGAHTDSMIAPIIEYGTPTLHNSGSVSLIDSGSGVAVPVVPLDELAKELPGLRLLKIDVEGMERQVLQGANELITRHRPLLYVENDRIEKSRALIEWIVAQGYRLWWHIPLLYNPENFFGVHENDYGNVASFNMFCQPKEAPMSAACGPLVEITDPDLHPLKA
jgi:FkbM family methyltransferase